MRAAVLFADETVFLFFAFADASPRRAPIPGDDEALLSAFRDGDASALGKLYERHRRALFSYLMRQLGDAALAEDLLQDLFVRIVKGASEFQQRSKFTTWAYTIARNLVIDSGRRGKLRRTTSLSTPLGDDKDGPTLLDTLTEAAMSTQRDVESREIARVLETALAKLPGDQREVFELRELAGLPFAEIAEVVGSSENTVKSRMRYALERLRAALDEAGLAPPDSET